MAPLLLLAIGMSALFRTQTCAVGPVQSSQPSKSIVYGQVLDKSGAPIPDAQVLLKSKFGERLYRVAGGDGCFEFTAPPMDYTLAARSEAFRISSVSFNLVPGTSTEKNIVLEVGGCTECVEVQGMADFSPCVVDGSGIPIAVAQVTLVPKKARNAAQSRTIILNDWGCGYAQLTDRKYQLSVTAPGYRPLQTDVSVKPGQVTVSPSRFRLVPLSQ